MFEDIFEELNGSDFEEIPVSIEEFVTSPDYLNLPTPLSEHQYNLIRVSTQIYKKETLIELYGEVEGLKRWSQTYKEIVFQLGKGSGKDFTSTIACAYVTYLLLCLKDPAAYYNKPPGDNIDIINIAVNATQAMNVFFAGFKNRIHRSPWFKGKYQDKAGVFNFDKNINVYSGHSEREAWEGYNVIYVVLDEISGFALESTSGNEQAKTAEAVFKMYRASLTSRFPDFGKLVLLSFPRFKNDFIQQRYNIAVRGPKLNSGEVETIMRSHTFKLDEELPDGIEGNEFTVEWEEDHVIRFGSPNMYALKRPSWEVNPTRKIEDYKLDFFDDPVDALSRFACMPPEAVDAFFKSREKIEHAFRTSNALDESNRFYEDFQPDPEAMYFVHVDLARKHDRCAVALAHVDHFVQRDLGGNLKEPAPYVKVDAIRYWTPSTVYNVDFTEVREYILSLQQRGFNIRLVTFDRWESYDISNELRDYGLRVENLSVAKKHYTDMAMVVHEERVEGPAIKILIDELLQLRIMKNDKVDHPTKGGKDLADAVCGAIYNAVAHTPREDREIIVVTSDIVRENYTTEVTNRPDGGVIRPPRKFVSRDEYDEDNEPVPESLVDYLKMMQAV